MPPHLEVSLGVTPVRSRMWIWNRGTSQMEGGRGKRGLEHVVF